MTPADLTARVNRLLAALDEPAGTVEVFTRQSVSQWFVVVSRPGTPLFSPTHPLDTYAQGDTEEATCDLAWERMGRDVHAYFDAAAQRLGRAQTGLAAAQREVTEAVARMADAGALRRAL